MDAQKLSLNLKEALRALLSDARYTVTIVLTLSVSMSVFLFLYGQVHVQSIKPLSFEDGERFVLANRIDSGKSILGGITNFERPHYSRNQSTLDDFGFYEERTSTTIATDQFSEQIRAAATDSNLFRLTKVNAIIGRVLQSEDEVNQDAAIISYRIWQRLFNGNDEVLGQIVLINGKPTKVVGVMPEGFHYPTNHDLWLSYVPQSIEQPNGEGWLTGFGKLKDGTTLQQAQDNFSTISSNLSDVYPKEFDGKAVGLKLHHTIFNEHRITQLGTMAATAFAILFMGILSAYSLIFVKLIHNKKVFAIQKALGISQLAIVRQPILEVIFTIFIAVAISIGFVGLLIDLSASYLFSNIPFWWNLEVNLEIIWFAVLIGFGVAVISVLGASLLTARNLRSEDVLGGSKGTAGITNSPWVSYLITLKLAFAFTIVTFTGLSTVAFISSLDIDYGAKDTNALIANVKLPEELSLQERLSYFERFSYEVSNIDGVASFTFGRAMPGGWGFVGSVSSLGANGGVGQESTSFHDVVVAENYLSALGMTLLSGREFVEGDNVDAEQVAIIPISLSRSIFGTEDSVGRRLQLNPNASGPVVTIVGVSPDLKFGNAATGWYSLPGVLRPIRQHYPQWSYIEILVKVNGDPSLYIEKIQNLARQIDHRVPLADLEPYKARLSKHGQAYRNLVLNFLPAALIALIMIAVGLYAVSERVVQSSARDIGIMRALGLSDLVIYKHFIKTNIVQYILGILLGIAAVSAFMSSIGTTMLTVEARMIAYVMLATLLLMFAIFLMATTVPVRKALNESIVDALKQG